MAADFPGTIPTFTPLTDDPGGDPYQVAQVNVLYTEVTAIGTHLGAGTSIASKGGLLLTIQGAGTSTTVGYTGEAAILAGAGTPITLVPGGSWDVAVGMIVTGIVEASDGQVQGGTSIILNGETVAVFDDGTNVYNCSVSAGGVASCVRASGSLTYKCLFKILWF